mgnify:FL=1
MYTSIIIGQPVIDTDMKLTEKQETDKAESWRSHHNMCLVKHFIYI